MRSVVNGSSVGGDLGRFGSFVGFSGDDSFGNLSVALVDLERDEDEVVSAKSMNLERRGI